MNNRVITFGEIMLRLTPPDKERFIQATSFNAIYGGGEANVAISLANYGIETYFVSKLPANPIGQAALNEVRKYGVNIDYIARGGNRLGIYYCENGASQRPSNVIYDRAYSALAEADSKDFDWERIFADADWFHFTGITPALSQNMAAVTKEAAQKASEMGVKISCDLNYRSQLWSRTEAEKVMTELMQFVDICIANEEDAEMVFGIKSGSDVESGEINIEGFKDVAEQLMNRFDVELVGSHLRISHNASVNDWLVVLYDGNDFVKSSQYKINIVDRVGGGDSFAAGLIYSTLNGKKLHDSAEFCAAASCLKQSIHGDFNHVSVEEVNTLAAGDRSGRVKR